MKRILETYSKKQIEEAVIYTNEFVRENGISMSWIIDTLGESQTYFRARSEDKLKLARLKEDIPNYIVLETYLEREFPNYDRQIYLEGIENCSIESVIIVKLKALANALGISYLEVKRDFEALCNRLGEDFSLDQKTALLNTLIRVKLSCNTNSKELNISLTKNKDLHTVIKYDGLIKILNGMEGFSGVTFADRFEEDKAISSKCLIMFIDRPPVMYEEFSSNYLDDINPVFQNSPMRVLRYRSLSQAVRSVVALSGIKDDFEVRDIKAAKNEDLTYFTDDDLDAFAISIVPEGDWLARIKESVEKGEINLTDDQVEILRDKVENLNKTDNILT